jgi:hypothetical protein
VVTYNQANNIGAAMNKRCSKCGEVKTLSEFYKNITTKDGYASSCRICYLKQTREYEERAKIGRKTPMTDEEIKQYNIDHPFNINAETFMVALGRMLSNDRISTHRYVRGKN